MYCLCSYWLLISLFLSNCCCLTDALGIIVSSFLLPFAISSAFYSATACALMSFTPCLFSPKKSLNTQRKGRAQGECLVSSVFSATISIFWWVGTEWRKEWKQSIIQDARTQRSKYKITARKLWVFNSPEGPWASLVILLLQKCIYCLLYLSLDWLLPIYPYDEQVRCTVHALAQKLLLLLLLLWVLLLLFNIYIMEEMKGLNYGRTAFCDALYS